jgi:hypothetical protein
MRTTFRISEADYVAAMKLYGRTTRRFNIVFWSVIAILHLVLFLTPGKIMLTLLMMWFCGLVFFLAMQFVITPYIARRHYRNYKSMHEEFQIELLPEGVYLTGDDFSNKVLWNKMLKWRCDDSYILIFIMPRLFYMVPQSLAAQGFDTAALMDGLTKHVGKPF